MGAVSGRSGWCRVARRVPMASDRSFALALACLLVVYNNVVQWTPGHQSLYVPVNLALAGALVATARRRGLTWDELGLSPKTARRGAVCGVTVAAAVAVGYAAVLLSPWQGALEDDRYGALGPSRLLYVTLVRVPLGTVVLEEVAFRAVLLAATARAWSLRTAVVVSSSLFGLWHVRPTLSALEINGVESLTGQVASVAGAVAFTTLAGALFCWLRLRSGSLVAPVVLHTATNSLGVLATFLAHRW